MALQRLEQRLEELSLRTFEKQHRTSSSSSSTSAFNVLQHVDALWHDLVQLTAGEFVGAGALLFSQSFAHNVLDVVSLCIRSQEHAKDLTKERTRLYECLQEFIKRAGSGSAGVQDHLARLVSFTQSWIRQENAAESLTACLKPLQCALETPRISFAASAGVDVTKLAGVLKERFMYGKASEAYSPGVKGALLLVLGLLANRCAKTFNDAPVGGGESLGAAVRRLSIACLEDQLRSGEPNLALVSGALGGLRHLLTGAPCQVGDASKEANQIFHCVRHLIKLTGQMKRYELPQQAICLLWFHSNLFAAQVMRDPDVLFDELRVCVHSKNDKIKHVAMPCCLQVLKTIAKCIDRGDGQEAAPEEEEEEGEEVEGDGEMKAVLPRQPSVVLTMDPARRRALLNSFMKRFSEYIQAGLKPPPSSSAAAPAITTTWAKLRAMRKDIDLAIYGFGCFARTIARLTDETRLSQVLYKLFELSDRLNNNNNSAMQLDESSSTGGGGGGGHHELHGRGNPYRASSKVNAKLFQRIRFLSTYGKIAAQLPASVLENEQILDRLEHDVLALQQDFTKTNLDGTHNSPHELNRAVEHVLDGLGGKGACLPQLLQRIVRPMLLHSLRTLKLHRARGEGEEPAEEDEADDDGEGGEDTFVYEPLWRRLLPDPRSKRENKAKEETFHALISVALHIIPELNLECSVVNTAATTTEQQQPATGSQEEEEEEDATATATSSYLLTKTTDRIVPRSMHDLRQFHLLALFLQRHKPVTDKFLLQYMTVFTRIVSNGLDKNPLVSSWYRLMSLAFSALDSHSSSSSSHGGALSEDAATMACLDAFLETTCLRANQYQDELLCASLTCVLQCPHGPLLEKHMRSLANCIVTALRMGLSHAPLAELAMDQLERWIAQLQDKALLVNVVLPTVLPELAGYLTPPADASSAAAGLLSEGESSSDDPQQPRSTSPPSSSSATDGNMLEQDEELIRRWRANQHKSRRRRAADTTTVEDHRVPLNLRAVRILGSVGGHNRWVLPKLDTVLAESKAWEAVKRVELHLPLGQAVLATKVDGLLPRVAVLATSSTHRQTKIAACELLHALILVMLGTSANGGGGGESFVKIYSQLFPSLLQLAVDVDGVARQLFLPLVEQLSKWFARDENSSEAAALLHAVIEALGDKSNSALRDLAARTLGVFFRWTFKSAGAASSTGKRAKLAAPKQQHQQLNSTMMLYHLYSLMRHPDPYKRLGSCAAFEAFYRDFREQPALVDEHALFFLENSLLSLRMSHYDPAALSTGEAASQVVVRLKRIVAERAKDFAVPANPARLAFEDLGAFVDWVFSMCASPETLLRERAQELFDALSSSSSGGGGGTRRDGLSLQWGGDWRPLVARCAASGASAAATAATAGADSSSNNSCSSALDECAARVQYAWWRARKPSSSLQQSGRGVEEDAGLASNTAELVSAVCRAVLDQPSSSSATHTVLLPPRHASSLCRFLRIAAEWSVASRQPDVDGLWECLVVALVHPGRRLGLDWEDGEFAASVPSALQLMVRVFGPGQAQAVLSKLGFSSLLAEVHIQSGKSENSALVRAAQVLAQANVSVPGVDVERLAQRVYSLPFGSCSPQALKDGSALLRLCFKLGWPVSSLLAALLSVHHGGGGDGSGGTPGAGPTLGFTFFQHFPQEICQQLCEHADQIGSLLEALNAVSLSSSPRSFQAFNVLSSVLRDPTVQTNDRFAATFFPVLVHFVGNGGGTQVCAEVVPLLGQILRLPTPTYIYQSQSQSQSQDPDELKLSAFECVQGLLSAKPASGSASSTSAKQVHIKSLLLQHCVAPFLLNSSSASSFYQPQQDLQEQRAVDLFEREIVGGFFPPLNLASKLVPGMEDCDAYLKMLHVSMDLLAETKSLLLLRVLCKRAIREIDVAVHRRVLQTGLLKLAHSLVLDEDDDHDADADADNNVGYMAFALECLRSLTGKDTASEELRRSKMAMFDFMLLPLCQRFSAKQWERLLLAQLLPSKPGSVFEFLMYTVQQPLSDDTSKECCYNALHCFFRFGTLDVVQRVQRAAFPANQAGNEATKIISKQARKLLTDEAETSVHGKTVAQAATGGGGDYTVGECEDLVAKFSPKERLCNAVFGCLVAVVEKTQSQAKFFDSLLFANGCNTLHALIPHRVDASTEPKFEVREYTVAAVTAATTATTPAAAAPKPSNADGHDDDDKSVALFTAVGVTQEIAPLVPVVASAAAATPAATASLQELCAQDEAVALERDCLNSLPAMQSFLLALDGMRKKQLITATTTTEPPSSSSSAPLPPFAAVVLDCLKDKRGSAGDARQSINVRLFAAKVVLNRPHLFAAYAHALTVPLVDLVVDLESPHVKHGQFRGVHAFIQDVCQLLASSSWWSATDSSVTVPPADGLAFSRLFALLFRLTRTSAQVELCGALLRVLGSGSGSDSVQADVRFLISQSAKAGLPHAQHKDDPDALPHAKIALALLKQCGAHGYIKRSPHESELSAMLLGVLAQPRLSTGITRQCAKVVAFCPSALADTLTPLLENLITREHDAERCLDILAGVLEGSGGGGDSAFVVSRVLFAAVLRVMPTLEGDYLKQALDVVLYSCGGGGGGDDSAEEEEAGMEIYQSLLPLLNRGKLLSPDNAHVSSIASALHLIEKLAAAYPAVRAKLHNDGASSPWLDAIAGLLFHHPGASIRLRCFDYLCALVKNGGSHHRRALVCALSDANEQIQKRAFDFWEAESPAALPMDRFLHLLDVMNPAHVTENHTASSSSTHHHHHHQQQDAAIRKRVESVWVCHVAQLLLGMARRSSKYRDLIFHAPLNSAAATTNAAAFQDQPVVVDNNNHGGVGGSVASSMNVPLFLGGGGGASQQSEEGGGVSIYQSQDSHMTAGNGMLVRATQQAVNVFLPTQIDSSSQQSFSSSTSSGMMATPASTMQRVRRRVGKQVTVLRKYRKGEVPDVQIGQKDVIEPLLALCGLDSKVSFHFLLALVPELLLLQGVGDDNNNGTDTFLALQRHLTALLEGKPSETLFATALLEFFTMLAVAPGSGVEIDPQLVGAQSLACKTYATGVFAIESYILRQQQQLPAAAATSRPTKQPRLAGAASSSSSASVSAAWRQLYALYDALNETDVLLGLSERASKDIQLATMLDLGGRQAQAIDLYGDLLQRQDDSSGNTDIWLARSRCLQKLRRWDDSFAELDPLMEQQQLTTAEDALSSSSTTNKRLIELYVKSGIKSPTPANVARTLRFLDRHSAQPHDLDLFEQTVPSELVLAELVRVPVADWGRALDRTNRGMTRFLRDFAAQPKLAVATRRVLLQPLPHFVDFLDAFQFRTTANHHHHQPAAVDGGGGVQALFRRLESSSPLPTQDGPEVWESTYSQRLLVLAHLRNNNNNASPTSSSPSLFDTHMEHHLLHLLNQSFAQAKRTQNFDICKVICREMKRLSVSVFPGSRALALASSDASVDLVFADRDVDDYTGRLGKALSLLQARQQQQQLDSSPAYFKRVGRLCRALGRPEEAMSAFEKRCELLVASAEVKERAQAHYDLGSFAEEHFSSTSSKAKQQQASLAAVAIENLLVSYALGSPVASNAFPRVLKLAMTTTSAAQQVFTEHVARIPTRWLLKWTAQLLSVFNHASNLDKNVTDCVLERIAAEFPQSFVYPFRVSREAMSSLAVGAAGIDARVKRRLDVLQRKMNLPHVVQLFCDALERLTHPELRLKELLKHIQTLFVQGDRTRNPALTQEAKRVWKDVVLGDMFSSRGPSAGKYHAEFAKQYESKAREEMAKGSGGARGDGSEATLQGTLNVIKALPQTAQRSKSGKCALGDFSSWLDNFALLGDKRIEIPGSRDPWMKGGGEATAATAAGTILGFDSDVLVMSSMRVPKRLTMRGMDNTKHDFLVKGGEDLRLDERIEQLFGLMNRLMELDVDCAARAQRIETYKVVPVSLTCGLIEWIPHSAPVKSVVESQYQQQQQPASAAAATATLETMPSEQAFAQFEQRFSKGLKNPFDMYTKLYSEDDAMLRQEYQKVQRTVPSDLLRRHFLGMSATPEAFLALKSNFAQSLAVLSVGSWVLGIGDRHLDNFMINAQGELVAIDFGYSFGIGVVLLPVPETLPFRFTPQFSQFLAPLNANGTFFHCARRTLKCLREGRNRMLEVMEVFVNEPLMDWVSQAGMAPVAPASSSSSSSTPGGGDSQTEAWRALISSRVRVADLKMRGVRPSLVMSAELMERKKTAGVDQIVSAVQRCATGGGAAGGVKGQGATTLRDGDDAAWIKNTVSVSEQVEELIRMSTDEAQLMRQWKGSRCWI